MCYKRKSSKRHTAIYICADNTKYALICARVIYRRIRTYIFLKYILYIFRRNKNKIKVFFLNPSNLCKVNPLAYKAIEVVGICSKQNKTEYMAALNDYFQTVNPLKLISILIDHEKEPNLADNKMDREDKLNSKENKEDDKTFEPIFLIIYDNRRMLNKNIRKIMYNLDLLNHNLKFYRLQEARNRTLLFVSFVLLAVSFAMLLLEHNTLTQQKIYQNQINTTYEVLNEYFLELPKYTLNDEYISDSLLYIYLIKYSDSLESFNLARVINSNNSDNLETVMLKSELLWKYNKLHEANNIIDSALKRSDFTDNDLIKLHALKIIISRVQYSNQYHQVDAYYINNVKQDSLAQKAGLDPGDIIYDIKSNVGSKTYYFLFNADENAKIKLFVLKSENDYKKAVIDFTLPKGNDFGIEGVSILYD